MLFAAGASKKTSKKIKLAEYQYRIAIIDLGTNSVRFDVYSVTAKHILRLHREKRMIRLGDQVFHTGRLSTESMQRGLKAFKDFQNTLESLDVGRVVAFATSAMRSASNADRFIKAVQDATGIEIQVISGRRESELIAKGIFSHLNVPNERLVLVDIGGGSTEVTLCRGKKILRQASLDLGANRLQQNFLKKEMSAPPRRGESSDLKLRQFIRDQLQVLSPEVRKGKFKFVIGSSGTIRNLAKILRKVGRKGQPFLREDLAALVSEMRFMNKKQLKKLPGLEPKRTDLILAGGLLFEEILYFVGAKKFYVTDLALRDGILKAELESGPFS